jgi:hypothetical protein
MIAIAIGIGTGIWWTANTIAHQCIHRPPFRRRAANACVDAALTLLLGFPQALWRARHLAHHAGVAPRLRRSLELVLQASLVLTLWTAMAIGEPAFFASAYVPGYATALLLCALQGHYEHAAGTTSHYGRLYNLLLFNDGYHVEHHRHPAEHWARLPKWREPSAPDSAWPAPLRWLEAISLEGMERLALRSALLQRLLLRSHARAFRPLVDRLPAVRSVAIIGGGLFPRTAIILRDLLPGARITIIDASLPNLERARALVERDTITFVHRRYDASRDRSFDLMVFPLAFDGDRLAIYSRPPAPVVLVHDWIWRTRGISRVVSVALLKRVNLVSR